MMDIRMRLIRCFYLRSVYKKRDIQNRSTKWIAASSTIRLGVSASHLKKSLGKVFSVSTPLEETIAKPEEDFRAMGMDIISDPVTIESDNKHSTKYHYKDANETMEGDIIYFVDEYRTTCGKVYLVIDFE